MTTRNGACGEMAETDEKPGNWDGAEGGTPTLFPVLLFLFLLCASLALWRHEARLQTNITQENFTRVTERINQALNERLGNFERLLFAVKGMFSHAAYVGRQEWRSFARATDYSNNYPGIDTLGYVAAIPQDRLEAFLKERRVEWSDFTITPPGQRESYALMTHLHPPPNVGTSLIGLDLATIPEHWKAMEEARDSGQSVMIGKPKDAALWSGDDLLLFLPVYGLNKPIETTEERRAALDGWVVAKIAPQRMFEGIAQPKDDIDVDVFDSAGPDEVELLFDTTPENLQRSLEAESTFIRSEEILIGGRRWLARYSSTTRFEAQNAHDAPWLILIIGGGLSAALPWGLYLALSGRQRATHLAEEMAQAYRRSEQRFKAIADYSYDWESWIGTDGKLRWVNPAVERMVGYSAAMCMSMEDYPLPIIFEDDQDKVRQHLTAALNSDQVHDVEVRLKCHNGHILWGGLSYQPIFDAHERFIGSRWSVRDITERKKIEHSFQESNKELENFAYVASHDLQEPLRMVIGYNQLLAKKYKGQLDADADQFIEFSVDGALRMQRLIKDLLQYSRVGTRGRPLEPTNMEQTLDVALANLSLAIEESGAVISRSALPPVLGDQGQLVSLLQNLIGNAIKYRKPDLAPEISVSFVEESEFCHFVVTDNGIGIEPVNFERIFMIFQRLHGPGQYEGTGIGLAICKKIVERHGGRIWPQVGANGGCEFHFTLQPASLPPTTEEYN